MTAASILPLWRRIAFGVALLAAWAVALAMAAGIGLAPLAPATRVEFAGRAFQVPAGSATADGDALVVRALGDDGTGLQTVRMAPLRAERVPMLHYRLRDFPRTLELALVFRRADDAADVQSISLPAPVEPEGAVDLRNVPGWQGDIIEVGFSNFAAAQLVPPSRAGFAPFRIEGISLQSPSWQDVLPRLRLDWAGYRPWALLSVSALGTEFATVPRASLPLALVVGLLLSLGVAAAFLRLRGARLARIAAAASLAAWVCLDLAWLADLHQRHAITETLYAQRDWPERAATQPDESTFAAATTVSRALAALPPATRVFVASDSRYTALRLIWFLLPNDVALLDEVVAAGRTAALPPGSLVAVIDSEKAAFDASSGVLDVGGARIAATALSESDDLRVYRVRGTSP